MGLPCVLVGRSLAASGSEGPYVEVAEFFLISTSGKVYHVLLWLRER